MTRLVIMTFFGEQRWKDLKSADGRDYHPHESPASMTVPMIVLAFGSVGAGVPAHQRRAARALAGPVAG